MTVINRVVLIPLISIFLTSVGYCKTTNDNASKPQNLNKGLNPLSDYKGHFEGSETDNLNGGFHKRVIRSDFDLSAKNPAIVVQDFNGAVILNLEFSKLTDKELDLKISALQEQTKKLGRDDTCYSDGAHQTHMCFYDDGMDLEITANDGTPVISLSLSHFASVRNLTAELPQDFTVSNAIGRAMKMNFDSRIEFEHVIQAKQTAKASYLNLLPHLSINSVLAILTPTPASIASVAGDLVPFLLPSRWFQAKRAKDQSQAEAQALILMRMDTATLVEGLFYTDDHDRMVQGLYKKLIDQASLARDEVNIREKMGQYATGSTDNINSIINKMNQDYSVFDQVIAEDLGSISQSLGYYTPRAVKSAVLDNAPDNIEEATPIDIEALTKEALERSFELKQIDDLMSASKNSKSQLYFNWLDPVGDPTAELGFNLKANFAVANSQLREITLKRSEIQSLLGNKAFDASTEYNQALKTYAQTKDGVAIDQRRLDQILNYVKVGNNVDLFHVVDVIQDNLDSGVRQANAVTTYRISRGKIDRLLLQGFYAHPDKTLTPPQVVAGKK